MGCYPFDYIAKIWQDFDTAKFYAPIFRETIRFDTVVPCFPPELNRITTKKGGLPTRQSSLLVGAGLSIGVDYPVKIPQMVEYFLYEVIPHRL